MTRTTPQLPPLEHTVARAAGKAGIRRYKREEPASGGLDQADARVGFEPSSKRCRTRWLGEAIRTRSAPKAWIRPLQTGRARQRRARPSGCAGAIRGPYHAGSWTAPRPSLTGAAVDTTVSRRPGAAEMGHVLNIWRGLFVLPLALTTGAYARSIVSGAAAGGEPWVQ